MLSFFSEGAQCFSKGNYEEALAFYEKAADLDPKNILAHYQIAAACSELGQYKKASKALKTAKKLEAKKGIMLAAPEPDN